MRESKGQLSEEPVSLDHETKEILIGASVVTLFALALVLIQNL